MRRGPAGAILAAAFFSLATAATAWSADENSDLDLIPQAVQQPHAPNAVPPPPTDSNQRIYLEDAAIATARRSNLLVPFPPPPPPDWQERLFLDARTEWTLDDKTSVTLSDRFNLRAEDTLAFPSHDNVFNEFREGYVSWHPRSTSYVDIGRINLKSGVALGFNPTDFFKTRAVVDALSVDPTVLREDRLGTLMALGQQIWEGGTLTLAYAPALYNPSKLYNNETLKSLDPSFDRTNAHNRWLLKASTRLFDDFSPEFLVYREGSRTSFGANLTEAFGQSLVLYGEWAGTRRASLIDEALAYGRATGSLPVAAPSPLPEDPTRHFQNQFSVGGSYTTESKITYNLEYHFNQDGFSANDWNNWFRNGGAGSSGVAAELWFIRGFALDQQEPLSQHSLFLRADWVDAFIPHLELSGFVNTDLYDGSSLAQLTASYDLSDRWTVGGLLLADLGHRHSEFGSLAQSTSVLLKVARYF